MGEISDKELIENIREIVRKLKWRRATSLWFIKGKIAHEYVTKDTPSKYKAKRDTISKLYKLMKQYMLRFGRVEIFGKQEKLTVYAVLDNYKYWFDPPSARNNQRVVLNRAPLIGYKRVKMYKQRMYNKKELDRVLPFLRKSILLLPFIEDGDSCIKIYRKLKGYVNYTYLQNSLCELRNYGLLKIRKEGNEAKSYLTERGIAAKQLVKELIEILQEPRY